MNIRQKASIKPEVIEAHRSLVDEFLASCLVDARYAADIAHKAVVTRSKRADSAAKLAARRADQADASQR